MSDDRISGIYQLHQVDYNWYVQIENVRQELTRRFSNEDLKLIHNQLNDLYSDIQAFLKKAFDKNPKIIDDYKVNINGHDLNFYDLKRLTENVTDRESLKIISENVNNIWGHFCKILKLSLPTETPNLKRSPS